MTTSKEIQGQIQDTLHDLIGGLLEATSMAHNLSFMSSIHGFEHTGEALDCLSIIELNLQKSQGRIKDISKAVLTLQQIAAIRAGHGMDEKPKKTTKPKKKRSRA